MWSVVLVYIDYSGVLYDTFFTSALMVPGMAGFTFEQDTVGAPSRNCTKETCHFLPTHNSPTIKIGTNLTLPFSQA